MADQIPHDRLTAFPVRRKAYELSTTISRVLEGEPMTPALVSLVLVLDAYCESRDLEIDELVEQVREANERGDLAVDDEDVADIDARLHTKH